jgi:hypothetical protein
MRNKSLRRRVPGWKSPRLIAIRHGATTTITLPPASACPGATFGFTVRKGESAEVQMDIPSIPFWVREVLEDLLRDVGGWGCFTHVPDERLDRVRAWLEGSK